MNHWIDVHAHINMLETPPEEAIKAAQQAGVDRIITIGTCPEDHPVVLGLAQKFYPVVHCTLGVHPHDAKLYDETVEKYLLNHVDLPEVVAVGEIGLDYFYEHSDRPIQQEAFRRQLQIAVDKRLPVEIHTRDAEEETVNILKEFNGQVRGLIHCFTGTQFLADEALALGLNISFSGVVTFKKADELRATCKTVPLDRLHVETDAPFLTPVPFRGKKNAPQYVVNTAEKVAELHGIDLETLAAQTKKNALNLFTKLQWKDEEI